jgi:hypothetical protein
MEIEMKNTENVETLDQYKIQYLFHMTHIDNLANILEHGLLAHDNPYKQKDISDCDVNSRRSRAEPIYHKSIHSYVPFYFDPKNPMLYVRRGMQKDIVMLVLRKELITQDGVLFTDGNASVASTSFYDDLSKIDKLDWACIHDEWWTNHLDGKRTSMAEVLVPDFVDVKNIEGIICNNSLTKAKIDALTNNTMRSKVQTQFYF